jgi:hypothetical protein
MMTSSTILNKSISNTLLAGLVFMVLLTPTSAFLAGRDGTALFFSFADLKKELARPSPSQWYLGFSWRSQQEQAGQEGPIERNCRWGNGLGFDSYPRPGMRPSWGY